MTRGKYAAKAERRRDAAESAQRADTAERERDRFAAELAALRESTGTTITGLRSQVTELRRQRDERAAPRIAELEAANNRLRAQRDAVTVRLRGLTAAARRMRDQTGEMLHKRFGLGIPEAVELVHALGSGADERALLTWGVTSSDPEMIEAVQRARGLRGKGSPGTAAPQPVALIAAGSGSGRGRMPPATVDAMAAGYAYAYDGHAGSFSISIIDGKLWVRAENAEVDIIDGEFAITVQVPASEATRLAAAITGDAMSPSGLQRAQLEAEELLAREADRPIIRRPPNGDPR